MAAPGQCKLSHANDPKVMADSITLDQRTMNRALELSRAVMADKKDDET